MVELMNDDRQCIRLTIVNISSSIAVGATHECVLYFRAIFGLLRNGIVAGTV